MSKLNLDHFKEHRYEVYFLHENNQYFGVLSFGKMNTPTLNIKRDMRGDYTLLDEYLRSVDNLVCREVFGESVFNLQGVEYDGFSLFCDSVIEGEQFPNCNKFEILFTGLSVWFEGLRITDIKEGKLTRDVSNDKFQEDFNFKGKDYTISNGHYVNVTSQSSIESNINIKHTIVVQKKAGVFLLTEVKEIVSEVRKLFSLIVGMPLSVIELSLLPNKPSPKALSLYFPSPCYQLKPLEYDHRAFCSLRDIQQNGSWLYLFKNFFANKSFRNIWNRMITAFDSAKTWEFDIVTRVIILEKYATSVTNKSALSLDEKMYGSFIEKLKLTIEEFKTDQEDLTKENLVVLDGMTKSILNTRNSSLPTLKEKHELLMGKISEDLRRVISFSDADFKLIKRVRDTTAHGSTYEPTSGADNISHEMATNDKLLVLLMCFAYLELGFTEKQIAKMLHNNHCAFVRNANIDSKELDRFLNAAEFITLIKNASEDILKNTTFLVLKYSEKDAGYYLDEFLTQKVRTEFFSSGEKSFESFVKLNLNEEDRSQVRVLSKVYLTNAEFEKVYYGAVIVVS